MPKNIDKNKENCQLPPNGVEKSNFSCITLDPGYAASDAPPTAKRQRLYDILSQHQQNDDDDNKDIGNAADIFQNATNQAVLNEGFQFIANTIRNTILEVDQNRERRHSELMQMLEKLVNKDDDNTNTTMNEMPTKYVTYGTNYYEEPSIAEDYVESEEYDENIVIEENEIFVETVDNIEPLPCTSQLQEQQTDNAVEVSELELFDVKPFDEIDVVNDTQPVRRFQQNSQVDEFKILREQMLEVQRRKMEDRERKSREGRLC